MSIPANLSGDEKRALLAQLLRERTEPVSPLSRGQQGMWLQVQRQPHHAALNLGFAARSRTAIDRRALQKAAQRLGERHPCLRTTFEIRRGEVVQLVRSADHLKVEEIDAVGWSDEQLQVRVDEEFHRPFDLVRGPLARSVLFHRGESDDVLLFVLHHLVGDFWSLVLLAEDWPILYRCERLGIPVPLAEETTSYFDFVAWQQRMLNGSEGNVLKDFWKDELASTDFVLELPLDFSRPTSLTSRGAMHPVRLASRLTDELRQLAQRNGVTLYATLMAAYQLLIGHAAGQESFCVGSPAAGRARPEFTRIVGYFSNILPIKADLTGNPTIVELLQRVGRISLGALAHQDYPFPSIVEQQGVAPDPSRTPLFQTTFTLEKSQSQQSLGAAQFVTAAGRTQKELGDLRLDPFPVRQHTSQTDLSLMLEDTPECLAGFFRYNTDLFAPETITRFAQRWERILRAFVDNPQQQINELQLLSDEEIQRLSTWGNGPQRSRVAITLDKMVARQATLTPQATALVDSHRRWTYAEMEQAARHLANRLHAQGIGPGSVIPLYLSRSAEMIVALLAVLKSGAAFAPLSPSDPPDRTRQLWDELQAQFIITDTQTDSKLSAFQGLRICINPAMLETSSAPTPAENKPCSAVGDLAYLIFTSGSTGRPQGVAIEHRAVGNTVAWRNEQFPLMPDDRVLLTFSYSFDPAVVAIFSTLAAGATLVIPPDHTERDPMQLADWLRRDNITILQMTPSQIRLCLEGESGTADQAVRLVICGGEPMPMDLPLRIAQSWCDDKSPANQRPRLQIVNLYGPTECACDVCFWECCSDAEQKSVPIGRPIANLSVQVLDPQGRLVPIGVPGELWISGVGLARGYWNNPALTAQRFVTQENARWFRTGDRVRWRADGTLEFINRFDQQIKLNGHRIEVAEIEQTLRLHLQIRDAAVVVHPKDQTLRLAACLVATTEGSLPSEDELRKFVRLRLPDYMVPRLWTWTTTIPTTANGKRDEKTLAAMFSRSETPNEFELPQTPLESYLAEQFCRVIGLKSVGRQQSFFDLGGSSIDAALLVIELQQKLNEYVYTIALYDAPTVAELATYLAEVSPAAVERCFGRESLNNHSRPVTTALTEDNFTELRQLVRGLPRSPSESKSSDRNPPMAFLLSAPRSGSTLTRAMLGGHPRIFAPPELQLLNFRTLQQRQEAFDRDRDRFWLDGTVRALMELFHLDADPARELMEQCERDNLTVKAFYRLMQERLENRWLLDKTPMYALDPAVLQQATLDFQNPKFIHLVRHPRAMQASFVKARLEAFFPPFLQGPHRFSSAELAELVWTLSQQNIREFLRTIPAERQLLIRFEDLVEQPQAVMERAARFLDLDFDPAMLTPQADRKNRMTDAIHPLARMLGDVRFHEHQGIDPAAADRWQKIDGETELGEPTWQLAEEFGYRRTESAKRGSHGGQRSSVHDLVIPLQTNGDRPPIYWIHPPGGIVVCYHALAKHLDDGRPVFAIRARGAHGEAAPQSSVEDMAAAYGAEILRSSPTGLIHLGGWSAGGLIAIEVSRWLRERGRECGLIALLDSSVPVDATQYPEDVSGLPPAIEYGLDISLIELARLAPTEQLEYILEHARKVGIVQRDTPLHLVQDTLNHLATLFHSHVQAVQQYSLPTNIGPVALFRPEESVTAEELPPDKGWGTFAEVEVQIVPGGHYTMVKEPHVQVLAGHLRDMLHNVEQHNIHAGVTMK